MDKKKLRIGFMVLALLLFGSSLPLPYYITMPGQASNVRGYVMVQGAKADEGSFSFTTVSMQQANLWSLVKAKLTPFFEIERKEEVIPKGESKEEFSNRQKYYMKNSQDVAIVNAYRLANKDVEIYNKGAIVLGTYEGFPANDVLMVGDVIVEADGKIIQTNEELTSYMKEKRVGDKLKIGYVRDGKKNVATLSLVSLPNQDDRVGLGVLIATDREVKENPTVTFNTKEIGGPSAGLMFTLEIINQLLDEDITKGYKIAGTGQLYDDGVVGPIGGISQKVVAASEEGIDIFFAPNENGEESSNYLEAIETAKEIQTKMKIVPVDTLEDALDYLQKLK